VLKIQQIILKGRVIVEGQCRAEALVSTKPLSFLTGVDPTNGKITEKNHDLYGKCIKDKALCFPHGHGSTVGSYVLYSLAKKNQAPKAIINQTADLSLSSYHSSHSWTCNIQSESHGRNNQNGNTQT